MGLSAKLITCLLGCLLVAFGFLAYRQAELHRRQLEEITFSSADALSGVIQASTRDGMLGNHREDIAEIIEQIGVEKGIHRIRIYNKTGRISYSSSPAEVGTSVDKKAEACYRCHAADEPLVHLNRPDRVRVFQTESGERVLGLIAPIPNDPSCSSAPCHAHAADERVLGVLDVTMFLGSVDAAIASGTRALTLTLAASAAAVGAIFAALIYLLVHRPVRNLYLGTRRVATGDLDFEIAVASGDEIGRLAESFNRMTSELKKARDELTEWGRSLEDRVEQKTAELRSAQEQVIQVERLASMGKLAAIVAHEINNPLAGILMSARVLLRRLESGQLGQGESAGRARESLEIVASEAARCGEIVKSLLEFTRKSGGAYSFVDPRDLVADSVRLVQHKLDLGGVEVRKVLPEDVPRLECDPQEIKQALVAVLINACEAMPERGGILECAAGTESDGTVVRISIKDNGAGMDRETREHALEPFFSTKQGSGVGLGLTVVAGILARHSGKIEIASEPGKGTNVTFRLPVRHPPARGEQTAANQGTEESPGARSGLDG